MQIHHRVHEGFMSTKAYIADEHVWRSFVWLSRTLILGKYAKSFTIENKWYYIGFIYCMTNLAVYGIVMYIENVY